MNDNTYRPRRTGETRMLLALYDQIIAQSTADKCVTLTLQEIAALLTQTEYLHWRTRWIKDDGSQDFTDEELDFIGSLAASIQDKLISPADCLDCGNDDCIEYLPSADFIEWNPHNPFNPEEPIPAGYNQKPWYTAEDVLVPGYLPTDVLCDLITTAPPSNAFWDYLTIAFGTGAPRFRVHVSGSGQVELHLLKMIQGGIALVWVDDNLTNGDVIDLQSVGLLDIAPGTADLIGLLDNAFDGDFTSVHIHEVDIETPGDHFIDVSFLPVLDASIVQSGWGGGLRKVVLCGFNDMPVPVFRTTDLGNGCKQIEYKYNDQPDTAYVVLTTVCDGSDGEPGAPGTPGQDGTDCDCEDVNTSPEDTPETTGEGGNLSNYCAGSKAVAQDFIDLTNYYINKFTEYNNEVITTINVVTIGLYELAKGTPLMGALVSIFEYMVSYDEAEVATYISNPTFKDTLTCQIYCAVKANGGFNEAAWNQVLSNYSNTSIPDVVEEFVGYALHNTYLFTDASKTFKLYSLNTDATCEALCTTCQTKWTRNATHFGTYHDTNITPYATLTGGIEWNGTIWAPVGRPSDYEVIVDFTAAPEAFSVTEVQIAFTNMGYGTPRAKLYVWKDGAWKLIDDRNGLTGAGGTIYTIMTFGRKFKFTHRWGDPPYFGSTIQKLSSVTVRGYGTEPDMLPDVPGTQ